MKRQSYTLALALLAGLASCDDAPRNPASSAPASPSVAVRSTPSTPPVTASRAASPSHELAAEPDEFDPHEVLTDLERDLLGADDADLTREQRVARAHAQRKLIMADPEHPLSPVLEGVEAKVASGEYATMAQDMWSGRAAFPDRDEGGTPPP